MDVVDWYNPAEIQDISDQLVFDNVVNVNNSHPQDARRHHNYNTNHQDRCTLLLLLPTLLKPFPLWNE